MVSKEIYWLLRQAESELGIFIIPAQSGGKDLPNEYNVSNGGTYNFVASMKSLRARLNRIGFTYEVIEHPNPNEYYIKIKPIKLMGLMY